ncbi:ATP-binding protein [Parapedobacter sp. ISTM3]|uniref:ATP-binding protein n=1 Tax=Parapedobacter sp. ISTM3 TaxID=2800130 RepID=UPI00190607DC|nr:AAA family ATPase [Parapedobacter sp. ISTM3]MBK1440725.1 ATP-binding protein [Parapedobacter sp. ISTM3]
MDILKEKSAILLRQTELGFQRSLLQRINWQNRLIGILGARGAGKTTLMLQRMKMLDVADDEKLYISLDDLYFTSHTLVETAEAFRKSGGRYLFVDEVHKYDGWARELKNLYDFYRDIHVVFTGSSIIEMLSLEVDLSRRAHIHHLAGFSFREFLSFEYQVEQPAVSLEDVLENHVALAVELNDMKPIKVFGQYLAYGYYPYYKEDLAGYPLQLANVVNLTIAYDLAFIEDIDKQQTRKINQLLASLATQVPFKPNISALAKTIGMSRTTLIQYLHYLEKAKLIQLVYLEGKGLGPLEKPGKLLLDNPNLFYALSTQPKNAGSIRESFFVNQLRNAGQRVDLAKQGDFIVDSQYVFEVGGAKKNFNQIADMPNAYVAADDIEVGNGHKIPLWLFGMLY